MMAAIALLSGCASDNIKPKLSVKVVYPIDSVNDWYLQADRDWNCEPPKALFEAGWEHRNGWEWGAYHWSSVLCGNWSNKAELYENGLYLGYAWGGFK